MLGVRASRQNCSSSLRPLSQYTDMSVRMKSAWLSWVPLELTRTKISLTSSTGRSYDSWIALNVYDGRLAKCWRFAAISVGCLVGHLTLLLEAVDEAP